MLGLALLALSWGLDALAAPPAPEHAAYEIATFLDPVPEAEVGSAVQTPCPPGKRWGRQTLAERYACLRSSRKTGCLDIQKKVTLVSDRLGGISRRNQALAVCTALMESTCGQGRGVNDNVVQILTRGICAPAFKRFDRNPEMRGFRCTTANLRGGKGKRTRRSWTMSEECALGCLLDFLTLEGDWQARQQSWGGWMKCLALERKGQLVLPE